MPIKKALIAGGTLLSLAGGCEDKPDDTLQYRIYSDCDASLPVDADGNVSSLPLSLDEKRRQQLATLNIVQAEIGEKCRNTAVAFANGKFLDKLVENPTVKDSLPSGFGSMHVPLPPHALGDTSPFVEIIFVIEEEMVRKKVTQCLQEATHANENHLKRPGRNKCRLASLIEIWAPKSKRWYEKR